MSLASRVGSAGRSRQADRELWTLRDKVLKLEEDLAASQAQLNNVTMKFNCLIDLLHKCVAMYFGHLSSLFLHFILWLLWFDVF